MNVDEPEKGSLSGLQKLAAGTGVGGFLLLMVLVGVPWGISNWDKIWDRSDKLVAARELERKLVAKEAVKTYIFEQKVAGNGALARSNNEFIRALCQHYLEKNEPVFDCSKLPNPNAD